MDNEQSPADSTSIEDRLSSFFGGSAPEEAPKTEDAKPEQQESQPYESSDDSGASSDESEAQQAQSPDLIDWEADDGEVVKVPAKVKDALERTKDYTRKTQELAKLSEAADDRVKFAEAKEKLVGLVMDDLSELRAAQADLKRYQDADWASLYNANPGQALQLQQQMRELERKVGEKQQTVAQKAMQLQVAQKQHFEKQWGLAEEGARQRIGSLTQADNAAMLTQVKALGFSSVEEFRSKAADPRLIHAVYKAAKWDALQANKGQAVQAAQKAPPVVKPGASAGAGAMQERKYLDSRKALKKSGSIEDAARLFMLRG